MPKTPTLKITDFTKEFNETVKRFKKDAVLVGIPEGGNEREEEAQPIGNAALLAINVFGSPANNIPARDVMSIGILTSKDGIAEEFKKAAKSAWTMGTAALERYYERAGILASNSIKNAINSQEGIDPPAESTLRARASRGFSGTKALVVTGQMRNAITYVVRSIWGK